MATEATAGDGFAALEVSDSGRLVRAPVVSVLMITYNHEPYLAEAIEGVLSQQCDFEFELIIGEDASSDRTREIALDYQKRFPEVVRVIYSHENVGLQRNARRIFGLCRGEFVSYCEGDDYWCHPEKLQRQVALLQADPGIGVVHSDWVRARPAGGGWQVDWWHPVHRRVSCALLQGELLPTFHYPRILRTCTRMARREAVADCLASPLGRQRYRFLDAVLSAWLCAHWRVGYVPLVTAVYRESPRSILRSGVAARIAFLRSSLQFDTDARAYFQERSDYPAAYRWEVAVGMALWGLRGRDAEAVSFALADLRRHFGPAAFLRAAWATMIMRWPRLHPGATRGTASARQG